ncbi:putative endonuclease [Salmonella phage 41]|nr:putative endonuclease [Salmonella phage 41]
MAYGAFNAEASAMKTGQLFVRVDDKQPLLTVSAMTQRTAAKRLQFDRLDQSYRSALES